MRNVWCCKTATAIGFFVAGQLACNLTAVCAASENNATAAAQADAAAASNAVAKPSGKEVLIPERVARVPDDNDYDDPESEFCHQRSRKTENFVLFWAREYGDDPAANPDARRQFDADQVLAECERFYDYYVNITSTR
jgi:hypothetical protein